MNRQHIFDYQELIVKDWFNLLFDYQELIVKDWFGDDIDMNTINSVRNRRGLQNNFLSSTTDDYNANGQATPCAKKDCRYDTINDLMVISSLKSIIALNNNNNPAMKGLYFPPDRMELDNWTYHEAPDSINVTCLMDAKRSFAAQFRQFDRGIPPRASLEATHSADDVPCGDVDCFRVCVDEAQLNDQLQGRFWIPVCYIISTTTLMMPIVTIMHYYKLVSINDGGDIMRWYATDDSPETIRMYHDGCDGCDAAMSHDGCDAAMHATDWSNGNDVNLIDCSDMCELIEKQNKDNESGDWRLLDIVNHTTSKTSHERSKRLVKWESGETTLEPALDGEFINTFADEISNRVNVKTILRNLYIKDWQLEPHHQNQNISERFIQELEKYANWIRNTSGAPPQATFLVLKYVCFIFNRTAQGNLSWRTPCEALNGQTPDVSMLLHWQRVYIKDYCEQLGTGFPPRSNEVLCHFVGFAETAGQIMSFPVWNPATKRLLHRSSLRAATDDDNNHPGNPPDDIDDGPTDDDDGDSISTFMPPYYALCMTGTTGELQDLAWMTLERIDLVSLFWNITLSMRAKGSWRTWTTSHTSGEIHITSEENGERRNDANYHYSISHFYSAGLDTFNIIVTYRFTDVKYCMTPAVDVSGIIIAHEVNAVAGFMNNGIYCNLGEVFSFASVIASSFNGLNVVDAYAPSLAHEYVGKAVIANAVWIGPCGDLMCTQVHYTFVWGELTCTKAYDTSVLIEPLHHGKDVSAMHSTKVNNSGVTDSDGFPSNGGFIYSHNADLLDIVVATLMDITDCDERLIVVARDIYGLVKGARLTAIVERCLMCDADHVSWTEDFIRRPIYEEHRALSRYGEQTTDGTGIATTEINLAHDATLDGAGRDVLSLVNGNCYICDGLNIHIPDTPPVYEDTPTYGISTGISNSDDVIPGDLDSMTRVPEWGVLEGIPTKQQPKRYAGYLAAIETKIDTRDKRVVGISGYCGLMNYDEHELSSNDIVNSRHTWGDTSMTFAAVNSDDSLLQVINEYNFESVNDCNGVLTMDTIPRRRRPMLVFAAYLGHVYMLCLLDSTDGSPYMILRVRPTCNIVCEAPMTTAPDTTLNVSASTGSAITAYDDTNAIIYYDAPARDRRHLTSTGSKQAHYVAGIEDCSMRRDVHETYASCADMFTIHHVNDCVNHAMPAYLFEGTTRRYLFGPCDVYHSALGDSILAMISISAGSTLQDSTVGYIATDTKLNGMAVGTTELCAPRYYIPDCLCFKIKSQNSTGAISRGEFGSNVTTTSTTCLNSGASSRMDHPSLDSNEVTPPGWTIMLQNDKTKQSSLWGATPTRFARQSLGSLFGQCQMMRYYLPIAFGRIGVSYNDMERTVKNRRGVSNGTAFSLCTDYVLLRNLGYLR